MVMYFGRNFKEGRESVVVFVDDLSDLVGNLLWWLNGVFT